MRAWFHRLVWLSDTAGSVLGAGSNLLLLFVIWRTMDRSMRSYAPLTFVAALEDLFYSLVEICTQHQAVVYDGVMFLIPSGPERLFDFDWMPLYLTMHAFGGVFGMLILPAQYYYRYKLIKDGSTTTWTTLFKALSVSAGASAVCACTAVLAVQSSMRKGMGFYRAQLDEEWLSEGEHTYLYAMDMRDPVAWVHTPHLLFWNMLATGLVVMYSVKIMRLFHLNDDHASRQTRRMQHEFTKVMIMQALNCLFFVYSPMSVMTLAQILFLRVKVISLFIIMPLSWLSFANALFTLCMIRKYRQFVRRMLCCGYSCVKEEATNVSAVSTTQTNHSKGGTS